jgi:hypothetical protein
VSESLPPVAGYSVYVVVFLSFPAQMQGLCLEQDTTVSFHTFPIHYSQSSYHSALNNYG